MGWLDIIKFVIGGTIAAIATTIVSRGLFLPTLRIPKNSPWQRLRLRLGWRWDYLSQCLPLETSDGSHRQLEIRLPVTNRGGRAAERCTVDLQVKRLIASQLVLPSGSPGYDTILHNPRWVETTKQIPQVGCNELEIAPGRMAWLSFITIYIALGQPAVDFNCPGEFLTSSSSMAVRVGEDSKPVSGLLTVYSRNTTPTHCYFTLTSRGTSVMLSLKRMFAFSLGAIDVWFPLPCLKVSYQIDASTLTELPGKVTII